MIRDIWTPSLVEILPPSILKDSKLRAAAEALDVELQKLSQAALEALFLPRLEELPHEILDHLSNRFHVDFYEPMGMTRETKCKLIRNSIYEHRIKGTKFAVENLLNKITAGAAVQEWFEYGGRPYFFRVNLKGLLDYGDNGETFMRMIEATKNARSWLDDIIFDLSKEHPDITHYVGIATSTLGNVTYSRPARISSKYGLKVVHGGIISGKVTFGREKKSTQLSKRTIRVGFTQLIHGKILYKGVDEIPDNFTIEDWERYLRKRWAEFKQNPVVEHYKHNEHGDWDEGEIDDPDNPDEPEFFPVDKDFLRLYWKFPYQTKTGEQRLHLRYTTHYDPREDLTDGDVKAVGEVGAAGGIFVHSKKKIPTTGLFKAFWVHKHTEKII